MMRALIPFTFLLLSFSFFGSESKGLITARSEYLDTSYLASTQVGTPDVYHGCFKGQLVVVTWNLPYTWPFKEMNIELDILYGDGTLGHFCFPLDTAKGRHAYRLITERYEEKQGIDTYRATLKHYNSCVARYEHQLWKELIEVDFS
jgi:hypothetical protein